MNIANAASPIKELRIRKPLSALRGFEEICRIVTNYAQEIDYSNIDKTDDIIKIIAKLSGCPGAYLNYRGAINHLLQFLRVRNVKIESINTTIVNSFWNHTCDQSCLPAHRLKYKAKFLAISRFCLFLQYQRILPESGWGATDAELCTNFRDVIEHLGVEAERANAQARQALHFIVWLRLHGIAREAIDNKNVDDFLGHDCCCGLRIRAGPAIGETRDRRRVAIQRFLRFLEGENPIFLDGVFIKDRKQLQFTPSALRYRTWLIDQKGLQPRTVYYYLLDVMRWLPKFGEDASFYTANRLRELAMSECCGINSAMQSRFIKSVRNYIHFRASEGQCNISLCDAIISRPSYRLSSVPRRLELGMVSKIIQSCNLQTQRGIRERAILTLLAQLGLRAVEVWRLRLRDFDWPEAKLRIHGKGGRGAVVPLTQDAGDAVLDYLQYARPQSDSDVLFLRMCHPYTPLARAAEISNIVRYALARCGQKGGAHVFRHTLATELLRNGRSLEEIATVLRHRSVSTTMIYAKVNEPMLKRLAEPWMGDHS